MVWAGRASKYRHDVQHSQTPQLLWHRGSPGPGPGGSPGTETPATTAAGACVRRTAGWHRETRWQLTHEAHVRHVAEVSPLLAADLSGSLNLQVCDVVTSGACVYSGQTAGQCWLHHTAHRVWKVLVEVLIDNLLGVSRVLEADILQQLFVRSAYLHLLAACYAPHWQGQCSTSLLGTMCRYLTALGVYAAKLHQHVARQPQPAKASIATDD